MYIIVFYVPEKQAEEVKNAIFKAGAGQIGNYSSCAWQTKGTGQFMPLEGSNAFIGDVNQLETVEEYKVEMTCSKDKLKQAIEALKNAHPYETPAYHVLKCENY